MWDPHASRSSSVSHVSLLPSSSSSFAIQTRSSPSPPPPFSPPLHLLLLLHSLPLSGTPRQCSGHPRLGSVQAACLRSRIAHELQSTPLSPSPTAPTPNVDVTEPRPIRRALPEQQIRLSPPAYVTCPSRAHASEPSVLTSAYTAYSALHRGHTHACARQDATWRNARYHRAAPPLHTLGRACSRRTHRCRLPRPARRCSALPPPTTTAVRATPPHAACAWTGGGGGRPLSCTAIEREEEDEEEEKEKKRRRRRRRRKRKRGEADMWVPHFKESPIST